MIYVRTRIYVAGPISIGDPIANCQRAIKVGFELMDAGYAPYIPHYSYFVDMDSTVGKGRYEQWIELDLSVISMSHALLRIPGPSAGADREVEWARKLGIPVFNFLEDLVTSVAKRSPLTLAWTIQGGGEHAAKPLCEPYEEPKTMGQLEWESRQRHG